MVNNKYGQARIIYPELSRVVGGVKEMLLISYLIEWSKFSTEDGWIYRTQEQIEKDTGLSICEQQSARRNLKRLGVLIEKYKGMPRKIFYKVNEEALLELVIENSHIKENLEYGNSLIKGSHNKEKQEACDKESENKGALESVINSLIEGFKDYGNPVGKNINNKILNVKYNNSNDMENEDEVLQLILRAMWQCGFPRKTLRSEIDRRYLLELRDMIGQGWGGVLEFFKKMKEVRQLGILRIWDWEQIIRKVDYILNWTPKPNVDLSRITSIQVLLKYFETEKPPEKYVRQLVFEWWNLHKFTDLTPGKLNLLVAKILKEYYNDGG